MADLTFDGELARVFGDLFRPIDPATLYARQPRKRSNVIAELAGKLLEAEGNYKVLLGEAMQLAVDADEDPECFAELAVSRMRDAEEALVEWSQAKAEYAAFTAVPNAPRPDTGD